MAREEECRQQEAIDLINQGHNVFLTGVAGSGKSHTINNTMTARTLVVASTGIAASHVGGITAHSAFGLPLGVPSEQDLNKVSKKFRELFSDDLIQRIVIDECSMLWGVYLDLISERLKKVKKSELPFANVQVVLVGDCLQLPVIVDDDAYRYQRMHKYRGSYFFQSKVWKEANFKSVYLKKVYRQDNLQQVALLNAIRVKDERMVKGKELYKHAVDRLNQKCIGKSPDDVLKLCNYNKDADKVNMDYHESLSGKEHKFKGKVTGKFKASSARVEEEFTLKEGSRVMILSNHPEELYCNGSVGVFQGVEHTGEAIVLLDGEVKPVKVEPFKWETVEIARGVTGFSKSVVGTMMQHPLMIAKAISTHKAQGMSLDGVEIDVGSKGSFSPAQTYVALSRVRSLDNMYLKRPLSYDDIKVCRSAMKFYAKLEQDQESA